LQKTGLLLPLEQDKHHELMLQQAEEKNFHFDLQGAVMASDAFFLS
jgi:AICAR transformylase/IMP cyclohydrolase PurH